MRKYLLIILILIVFVVLQANLKQTDEGIKFSFYAPSAESVFLAGSFNDWNSTKTPLQKIDDETWATTLKLPAGKYQYKFVVDDEWYFDQENPRTEDDGYGGANSVVEIDSDGSLIIEKQESNKKGVKSFYNPRIFFSGRYYNQNFFEENDVSRYSLAKPVHYLQLGIRMKLADNFESFALMNLNNETNLEDGWMANFNYTKSYFKIDIYDVEFSAYDDYGIYTSDDPLRIIGDIGKEKYDHGFDERGAFLRIKDLIKKMKLNLPLTLKFVGLISENLDQNYEVNAVRSKIKYFLHNSEDNRSSLSFGSTAYFVFDKLSYTFYDLDHRNFAFDLAYEKNLTQQNWLAPLKVKFLSEYSYFENISQYQYPQNYPYMISDEFKWMNGEKWFVGSNITFPKALDLAFDYQHHNIDFFLEKEQSGMQYVPSPELIKQSFDRHLFNFASGFKLADFSSQFSISYKKQTFPDSLISWTDYYIYMEKTNATGRWFQEFTNVPFSNYSAIGYETSLVSKLDLDYKKRFFKFLTEFGWKGTFVQRNLLYEPKYIENIFTLKFHLNNEWNIYSNTRLPVYNNEFLNLKTDIWKNHDLFVSNYTALNYQIQKNIRLSIGWGVSPFVIDSVTDEFYNRGREEFMEDAEGLSEYIEATYNGLGQKIKNAEKALEDEHRISLEAVITF